MSRWPPSAQLEGDIDRLQRKMVSIFTRVERLLGEPDERYYRRRVRHVGDLCRTDGLWSALHGRRVIAYHDHMLRDENDAWTRLLQQTCDAACLQMRRLAFGSASVFAGRTDTRLLPGRPGIRWHDGVEFARRHLR